MLESALESANYSADSIADPAKIDMGVWASRGMFSIRFRFMHNGICPNSRLSG